MSRFSSPENNDFPHVRVSCYLKFLFTYPAPGHHVSLLDIVPLYFTLLWFYGHSCFYMFHFLLSHHGFYLVINFCLRVI